MSIYPSQPSGHAQAKPGIPWQALLLDILFLAVLLVGGYFRTLGTDWDQGQHLHPDERFLTMVEGSIQPVHSTGEYFDTSKSTLNPHNVGYTFYVYGTLPLFIIRYVAEWTGQTGYGQLYLVGRQLSAAADLLTVLLAYLIARHLYGRRVALLTGAFSAFAVLQIQLSHFMAVDTFTNLFTFLAFFFAVRVAYPQGKPGSDLGSPIQNGDYSLPSLANFLLFGAALGMAMASKVSAAPLAVLLPMACALFYFRRKWLQPDRVAVILWFYMLLAAVVAFLVFRIGQPYAFSGPGFFGIKLNPLWIANLKELSNQALSDVPWALQWARRPFTFALTNVVEWGLGLPLGILAIGSFLWMAWRILKGEWYQHLLVWIWTLGYFAWQSTQFSRSMRYQLLIYPTLAMIAGWGLVQLWKKGKALSLVRKIPGRALQLSSLVLTIGVVASTLGWAYAFTRIYTEPVTRVQASDWILENVPGPINIVVGTTAGDKSIPLPYRAYTSFTQPQPYYQVFTPQSEGFLTGLVINNLWDGNADPKVKSLTFDIMLSDHPDQVLASAVISDLFGYVTGGNSYTVQFINSPDLHRTQEYLLRISLDDPAAYMAFSGQISLYILDGNGQTDQQALAPAVERITPLSRYLADYNVPTNGFLTQVTIPHMVDLSGTPGEKTLRLTVSDLNQPAGKFVIAEVLSEFRAGGDGRGSAYTFKFDQPLEVAANQVYNFAIDMVSGAGEVAIYGSWPVNESSFDDALPLYGIGYAAYGDTAYIYRGDLKYEPYWPDNAEKAKHYQEVLDQGDYIFISSNRQWGSTVRVPERYPLTTLFYRELIGCPAEENILTCYSDAKPGMYLERLGYKLVAVFQSNPHIGTLEFNDQPAEEAFTVYDHPKVLIFQKQAGYNSTAVAQVLDTVDYSLVMNLLPFEFKSQSENLMLPPDQWSIQQNGGTWAGLFNTTAWFNRFPGLGGVLWYLCIFLLGVIVYPLIRLALPGLADRGYPLARTAGLVIFAYLVWLGGSAGWRVDRLMITQVFIILLVISGGLAYLTRRQLAEEFRRRGRYFIIVECVALAFFAIDLGIRFGNPDLWHTAYGGEKPMDFSYFNAILKSSTFPPYDPWFAGGYINYYYYGYVIAGVLVKWLGIVPAVAYNLILPTLFSLLALGAFSAAWNLVAHRREIDPLVDNGYDRDQTLTAADGINGYSLITDEVDDPPLDPDEVNLSTLIPSEISESSLAPGDNESILNEPEEIAQQSSHPAAKPVAFSRIIRSAPFLIGLAAAVGVVLIGNLGTVRMIWTGFQRLAAPNGVIEGVNILVRLGWAGRGLVSYISGAELPYSVADWYWKPSRAIQPEAGNEITEFPFFTFLYGDLHAHMIALPITLLLMGCLLSLVLSRTTWTYSRDWKRWAGPAAGIALTALALGALRTTNTWDFYTYLVLTAAAVFAGGFAFQGSLLSSFSFLSGQTWRFIRTIALMAGITALAILLYKPFSDWYQQAYNEFTRWEGETTVIWSYLTHWGLFLFIIASWMLAETRQWLANTPVSALIRAKPYWWVFRAASVVVLIAAVGLAVFGIQIGWLVVILGAWAILLILKPGQDPSKRIVLFLFGSGLVLTLFVEVFVLRGDIGRMNTVFKFYLQVWVFFAVSSAASLFWFFEHLFAWRPRWSGIWIVICAGLVMGAALYPLMGGLAKIRDRMAPAAPRSLDGMAFMQYATYTDTWGAMDLSEDYRAIRWLQENVNGSQVIVEANNRNLYRWGSRMTIYTGLPGVVGWEWHQQQQRAVLPGSVVTNRILEIEAFYRTTDIDQARAFLAKYNVGYIILGQQEMGMYAGPGLDKFETYNGILWQEVYRDGNTVIYQSACKCSTG